MDHITPLVYLIRECGNFMSNSELNKLTINDVIVYGTPLTVEEYQADRYGFLIIFHDLTMGGTACYYTRRFGHAWYRRISQKSMKRHFKENPQKVWTK